MRYELTDHEWTANKPMPPNKPRGARINDRVASSETQSITAGDLNDEGLIKLAAGRKRHALLRPV